MGKGSGRGGNATTRAKSTTTSAVKSSPDAALTLIIDGRQYDLTEFEHPGGDAIVDLLGLDASTVFYSTHPPHVWKQLHEPEFERKHLIAEPQAVQQKRRDALGGYDFQCDFYRDCKQVMIQADAVFVATVPACANFSCVRACCHFGSHSASRRSCQTIWPGGSSDLASISIRRLWWRGPHSGASSETRKYRRLHCLTLHTDVSW